LFDGLTKTYWILILISLTLVLQAVDSDCYNGQK
jgi:hypothetical protein